MKQRIGLVILTMVLLIPLIYFSYMIFITETEGVTEEQANEVYKTMAVYVGRPAPPLKIVESNIVNAWWDGKTVTLTTAILKSFNSVDECAEVIGHELGHYALSHLEMINTVGFIVDTRDLEDNADKYAIYLMLRSGYDVCQANKWMQRMREIDGDIGASKSHPSESYRIWIQTLPMCKGK